MTSGNTTIVHPDTGKEYHLTQKQLDDFNAAYAQALAESTQEHLTGLLIQDQILVQQVEFNDQKRRYDRASGADCGGDSYCSRD